MPDEARALALSAPRRVSWVRRDFTPSVKVVCTRCRKPTHPVEMIAVPAWGSICARCVEDIRGDKEATG